MVNILKLSISRTGDISFSMNIFAMLGVVVLFFLIKFCIQYIKKKGFKQFQAEAMNLATEHMKGSNLKFSHYERETAYKIWVEMETRNIGQPYVENRDAISDLHDSWSGFLSYTRGVIQEIPNHSSKRQLKEHNLTRVCIAAMNQDLKPYLDNWQTKYKKWYENALQQEENASLTPQEVQKKYEEYGKMVTDISQTNEAMLQFKDLLYGIAYKIKSKE